MSRKNRFIRVAHDVNSEYTRLSTDEYELSEVTKKDPENDGDSIHGLRNRLSIGEIGDDEFLLNRSKSSSSPPPPPPTLEDSQIPMVAAVKNEFI